MANKARLMELKEVIRENRHRWNQASWAEGMTKPNAASYQECQTSFCAAGWAAVIAGYKPIAIEAQDVPGIFYANSDNMVPRDAEARIRHRGFSWDNVEHAQVIGREFLNLTPLEEQCLFLKSADMTDFDEFATLIDAIADGRLNEWLVNTNYESFHYPYEFEYSVDE